MLADSLSGETRSGLPRSVCLSVRDEKSCCGTAGNVWPRTLVLVSGGVYAEYGENGMAVAGSAIAHPSDGCVGCIGCVCRSSTDSIDSTGIDSTNTLPPRFHHCPSNPLSTVIIAADRFSKFLFRSGSSRRYARSLPNSGCASIGTTVGRV